MKFIKILFLILIISCSNEQEIISQNDEMKLITFKTEDNGSIEAALFPVKTDKIVIFAHGAVFNKESWYPLAKKFQKAGIAALSIDFRDYGNSSSGTTGNKYYDILGAIKYAYDAGYTSINITGGSMGGAAVLSALDKNNIPVSAIVLMAPAGGLPVSSKQTRKLFIVSKDEGLYTQVVSIYDKSTEPKTLKIYPGNTHAQHLFKTEYAGEIEDLIISFIKD